MKPTRREFVSSMALAALGARYVHAAEGAIAAGVFNAGVSGMDLAASSGLCGAARIRSRGVTRTAGRYESAGSSGICCGQNSRSEA